MISEGFSHVGWLYYFEPEARLSITVAGACGEGSLCHGRLEAELEGQRDRCRVQGFPSDVLPPARLCLLKFLLPLKTVLSSGDRHSAHAPGGGQHLNHNS